MNPWSLPDLFDTVNADIETRLGGVRASVGHATDKGDASERVWLDVLEKYLPARYAVRRAHVVDSQNKFSEQIDIVIHDRQYSPFVFHYEGIAVVPAESVYGVLEAKQTLNAGNVSYAHRKIASVRRLHRTSLPIPTANGEARAKVPERILGGIVTLASDWKPALGSPLQSALAEADEHGRLDLGCIASAGTFQAGASNEYEMEERSHAVTCFLLSLIARLQRMATVPMIDVAAYAKWLRT
jgi:hypothetical protein